MEGEWERNRSPNVNQEQNKAKREGSELPNVTFAKASYKNDKIREKKCKQRKNWQL